MKNWASRGGGGVFINMFILGGLVTKIVFVELNENLTLGGVCNMHVGIFYLEHVKVIWGHSVHFSKNWAVTQKRLIVE